MTSASLLAALGHLAHGLNRRNQPFALVGGIAISVRGEPRFTRDVDVAIAAQTDAQVEALVRFLADDGYAIAATVEDEATHRLMEERGYAREQNLGAKLDRLLQFALADSP